LNKNVVIIGAGRISYPLASALTKSEYNIVSIISKNINSSKALAKKIRIDNFSDDLNDISKSASIYFLTVPDGEIAAVASEISKLKLNFRQSLFIHLSGAENISVLKSLKRKKAKTASLHPMQTFPSKKIVSLKGVHAALETDNESTYKSLLKISKDLHLIPFRIESKNKSYYHLAGIYASNFLAGNLYLANQLLSLNKIDREKHFDILRSTINSTLKNIENVGPANALSGPVDRGDIQTIKNHISSLKKIVKKSSSNYFSTLLKNYLLGHLANSHRKIKELLVQELNAL
jgi:predicted short-subunit dehydrogenase-like oxidoreductase (DUF2520 family)